MLAKRCRLLLKRIYNSIIMFNQDNLAAAQIAQIFGSELLKVQQSARTDGGSMPEIVKMDPKQFLVGHTQYNALQKEHERRITESLQREAEAAYPLDDTSQQQQQQAPAIVPPQPTHKPSPVVNPLLPRSISTNYSVDLILERIAVSLERIANAVDKVEIKTKKKTIKRNKPKTIKPTLLNETTA